MVEVEEKRNDLENFKSDILTQLREQIYQCDLTLKAVRIYDLIRKPLVDFKMATLDTLPQCENDFTLSLLF